MTLPRIDSYAIHELIAEGGMGVVYLAEQLAPIRRRVALKVIKPGLESDLVLARFRAERQALALLNHPTVAAIYDAGTTADGRPFFAMEDVDGEPFTDYCDRNELDLEKRLRLFVEVCRGVQHAHAQGIIHRDLNPSNILTATRDAAVVPKIIDFGVAKVLQQSILDGPALTRTGMVMGTPTYWSHACVGVLTILP